MKILSCLIATLLVTAPLVLGEDRLVVEDVRENKSAFGQIEEEFDQLLEDKKLGGALDLLQAFLKEHPDDGLAHRKIGWLYSLVLGKPDLGAIHMEKAWNLTKEPEALIGLFTSLVKGRNTDEITKKAKLFADNFDKLDKPTQVAAIPFAGIARNEELFMLGVSSVTFGQINSNPKLALEIARAAKAISEEKTD